MTLVQACIETFDPSACPLNILYPSPNSEDESVSLQHQSEDLTEWIIMSLDEVDPDSTSLLPHQIALIDLGDKLIVRLGRDIDRVKHGESSSLQFVYHGFVEKLITAAMEITIRRSQKRFPIPPCHLIKEGTPQERMVYSRLNPAHCDTKEIIEKRSLYFGDIAPAKLQELLSYYPYTDQKSYIQYLSKLVPKYAQKVEISEYHRHLITETRGVQSISPMERTITSPPKTPLPSYSQEKVDELI